jgi:hypothetical protein
MPPHSCPLIDHIQAFFAERPISMPPIEFDGVYYDDLHSMLEALRRVNADLRIGALAAEDLEMEVGMLCRRIEDLESEVARLRRSIG